LHGVATSNIIYRFGGSKTDQVTDMNEFLFSFGWKRY